MDEYVISVEEKQTKNRRCSFCHTLGHTKRQCGVYKEHLRIIPIQSQTPQRQSVHIINLREREPQQTITEDIPVFIEPKIATTRSEVISFAALINEQQTSRVQKESSISAKEKNRPAFSLRVLGKKTITSMQEQFSRFQRGSAGILFRPSIAMVLVLLIISFPLSKYISSVKADTEKIAQISTHAFTSLGDATFAAFQSDMGKAEASLSDALQAFFDASVLIEEKHPLLQSIARVLPVIGKDINGKYHLLEAGQHMSIGNTYLLKGVKEAQTATSLSTSNQLELLIQHLRAAKPQYQAALLSLAAVDAEILPLAYQKQFRDLQVLFTAFVDDIDDITTLADTMNTIVGSNGFRRYIVVTQNSAEIRATGGFWGAAALCDFQQGNFLGCEVLGGGLYDLQGQYGEYIAPPAPLQIVNKRWECHDMNWWPDFASSAELLANCFQKSRGITVDGVIAVNASVLEKILSITGPIINEEHDVVLTAETALEVLQKKVEVDYDKEQNTPKAILGDVLQDVLAYNYSQTDIIRLLTALHDAARTRDIQAFLFDNNQQEKIASFGWNGALVTPSEEQDYLLVVNSNLLGEKSDARIEQHIEHQAVVNEDGTIDVTVLVTREHIGMPEEQFYGKTNLNYIRFYVPEGSVLLDAAGFQYPPEDYFHVPEPWYEKNARVAAVEDSTLVDGSSGTYTMKEQGKTVFANWMMTQPGTQSQAYVVYRLPFTVSASARLTSNDHWVKKLFTAQTVQASSYSLYIQKQSGTESYVHTRVIYPDSWRPIWRSDERIVLAQNGATFDGTLTEDIQVGVVMEQQKN